MDFAFDGVKWWSILILDGYSRTILAGALAPSEASWATLMVLYTACARYGAPQTLISDSGGAFIADAFEGVCTRLGIAHHTIVSTEGQSSMNLMGYSREADRSASRCSRTGRDSFPSPRSSVYGHV